MMLRALCRQEMIQYLTEPRVNPKLFMEIAVKFLI